MKVLAPTPRWPLYEKRCADWARALKRLNGEFHRDPFDQAIVRFMILMCVGVGLWCIWATTIGPQAETEAPWTWVLPALGAGLLGLGLLAGRRALSRRYCFGNGEVREVSGDGSVHWRESLSTLQNVSFPLVGGSRVPPRFQLHWATHHRTLELFPSIDAAVREVFRAERAAETPPQSAKDWRCMRCSESNPDSFEVCWHCGSAAPERHD